jgi:hypothetical protein
MASPTAIKALTGRLRFQLDEPNISFDPLMDSGRDTESPHGMRECLWFCWSVPIVWRPRVWLQDLERVSPAEWRGDLWLVKLSPLAVSLEACEGAISISGRGKDDWRFAIECLMDSDDLVGVTSQCRCHLRFSRHSPPCGRRAFANAAPGQKSCTTSAQSYDGEFYGTHKKRGSYEGLYAAGVYREDCRRVLRRLR